MTRVKITDDVLEAYGRGISKEAVAKVRALLELSGVTDTELHKTEIDEIRACYRRAAWALRQADDLLAIAALPAGVSVVEPHPLQEHNAYGNDCHRLGCMLTSDEHVREVVDDDSE